MTAQLNIVNIWLFRKQIYKGIREILFFIFIIKLISYCPSLYHEDICLFGGFVYLKSFSLIIMETSPLLVKGFKSFYILTRHSWPSSSENSFFSIPHLLWHETSVYDGHFRGPLTAVKLSQRLRSVYFSCNSYISLYIFLVLTLYVFNLCFILVH